MDWPERLPKRKTPVETGDREYLQLVTGLPIDQFAEFNQYGREAIIRVAVGFRCSSWSSDPHDWFHYNDPPTPVSDFRTIPEGVWAKFRGCGKVFLKKLHNRGWVRAKPPEESAVGYQRERLINRIEKMRLSAESLLSKLAAAEEKLKELDARLLSNSR